MIGKITLIITVTIFAFSIGFNGPANTETIYSFSEVQRDIDRLADQAQRGEEYDAAIDGLVAYVENGEIGRSGQIRALLQLGEIADPDLQDYLIGISEGEVRFENSEQIRGYAHRAYWATRLANAADKTEEEQILLDGLEATHVVLRDGEILKVTRRIDGEFVKVTRFKSHLIAQWAATELCQRGYSKHFEKIETALKHYSSDQRENKVVANCRVQLAALDKHNTRLGALEEVLAVINSADYDDPKRGEEKDVLAWWALHELLEMRSLEADEVMFDHVIRAFERNRDEGYEYSSRLAISLLHQRGWTYQDYLDRGADPDDQSLKREIILRN
jgi:hypothetical protein